MADQKRSQQVTVRITAREHAILREVAHRQEMSMSSYLREAGLARAVEDARELSEPEPAEPVMQGVAR